MSIHTIRRYAPTDLDAVYHICLKTGDSGEDATHLYDDPKVLGHLYAGPYVTLEPDLAFVLTDDAGVCGYVIGALDTRAFYARYVSEWLPPLQAALPNPTGNPERWTRTERFYRRLHHPELHFPRALWPYPSHLHIDLLPRAQRQGQGTRLIHTLLAALREKNSPAVHLGTSTTNRRAEAFYQKLGFAELLRDETDRALFMGMRLEGSPI